MDDGLPNSNFEWIMTADLQTDLGLTVIFSNAAKEFLVGPVSALCNPALPFKEASFLEADFRGDGFSYLGVYDDIRDMRERDWKTRRFRTMLPADKFCPQKRQAVINICDPHGWHDCESPNSSLFGRRFNFWRLASHAPLSEAMKQTYRPALAKAGAEQIVVALTFPLLARPNGVDLLNQDPRGAVDQVAELVSSAGYEIDRVEGECYRRADALMSDVMTAPLYVWVTVCAHRAMANS